MFYVSDVMAALWWITGLGTSTVKQSTTAVADGRLSVFYTVIVYMVYAFLGTASVSGILSKYNRAVRSELQDSGASRRLQIWIIRDMGIALLFVVTTAVYWSIAAYRREHVRVYDKHIAIEKQLFSYTNAAVHSGRSSVPSHRALAVCCWALYALLAVTILLNVSRYTYQVSWAYMALYEWSHYGLLTGKIQFAVTVFRLRQFYRELNVQMRAGRPERRNNVFDYNGSSPATNAKTSMQSLSAPDFLFHDVMFVGGENS